MNNFKINVTKSLNTRWRFQKKNLENYRPVLSIGCGQTGYMINSLMKLLTPFYFHYEHVENISAEAINTLGKEKQNKLILN
jgi:hypothetical protein